MIQLEHLLGNFNIDFLFWTETWLTHNTPEAVVVMPWYNVFREERDNEVWRGFMLCKYFKM